MEPFPEERSRCYSLGPRVGSICRADEWSVFPLHDIPVQFQKILLDI